MPRAVYSWTFSLSGADAVIDVAFYCRSALMRLLVPNWVLMSISHKLPKTYSATQLLSKELSS